LGGVLTAVIFFPVVTKLADPPVGRRMAAGCPVSEQPRPYHKIVEKGRKNRAIPLIWRCLFGPCRKGRQFNPL
jgi:hypothetical protein